MVKSMYILLERTLSEILWSCDKAMESLSGKTQQQSDLIIQSSNAPRPQKGNFM